MRTELRNDSAKTFRSPVKAGSLLRWALLALAILSLSSLVLA